MKHLFTTLLAITFSVITFSQSIEDTIQRVCFDGVRIDATLEEFSKNLEKRGYVYDSKSNKYVKTLNDRPVTVTICYSDNIKKVYGVWATFDAIKKDVPYSEYYDLVEKQSKTNSGYLYQENGYNGITKIALLPNIKENNNNDSTVNLRMLIMVYDKTNWRDAIEISHKKMFYE